MAGIVFWWTRVELELKRVESVVASRSAIQIETRNFGFAGRVFDPDNGKLDPVRDPGLEALFSFSQ
ncbi:hypothetical protein L195_g000865 [Trifolium pratense]|uniref:Uncharacterized protein n=1 Tax=Trifolium pratense TaxID=57577 RepID=A0A2K3NN28_TRIPR|nr:hypothetical protein L195_g000865 [Trifolium pratense]